VSILFAAFLGYNPIEPLLGDPVLNALPPPDKAALIGHSFLPDLISAPFHAGLTEASSSRYRRPHRRDCIMVPRRQAVSPSASEHPPFRASRHGC
jgi:hypothetical protein